MLQNFPGGKVLHLDCKMLIYRKHPYTLPADKAIDNGCDRVNKTVRIFLLKSFAIYSSVDMYDCT